MTQSSRLTENPLLIETVVVAKVQKPWYAWRKLVVGKMEESIPVYQKVKGLSEKYFSLSPKQQDVGGIYLWEKESDAQNWFNQGWFERTEKRYGKKGTVSYYKVQDVHTNPTILQLEQKNLFAVITYCKEDNSSVENSAEGLIKILTLVDSNQQKSYLSLWHQKKQALKYLQDKRFSNEFFDIPFFIFNHS